jgi:acetyl esterase
MITCDSSPFFMNFTNSIMILVIVLFLGVLRVEAEEQREKHPWNLGCKPDKILQFYQPENGAALNMDVFFPENDMPAGKRGCIIFFFGGGWSSGSTAQFHGYSRYFASRGMVAISAQYRTAQSHHAKPRQCVEDGKSAIRYVREHSAELGVDPNKIVASGGSAGGHVAAACAMCPKIDAKPDSPISRVPNALVLFNPVYDNGPTGFGNKSVVDYWRDISPLHNIRKGQPPTVVFVGSNDKLLPIETVNAFEKHMIVAGNECETHIYEGEDHGFFHISKGGRKMFEDVLVKTDAFLVKHGYLSGENAVAKWTDSTVTRLRNQKPKEPVK